MTMLEGPRGWVLAGGAPGFDPGLPAWQIAVAAREGALAWRRRSWRLLHAALASMTDERSEARHVPGWPPEPTEDEHDDEAADTCEPGDATPPPHPQFQPGVDDTALAALMVRVVDRDETALALLYQTTSARIYGLVLRITPAVAIAEEVVEDTYWQAWRQAPRFDPQRGSALAWLMAMARSRAIDALRSQRRFEHDEFDETHGDRLAEPGAEPLPDLLDATRRGAALHEALAALDSQPRQLVALAFFRGLTHEEIAEQTGLALGTVKSQIRRSLQTLRRLIGGDDGGHDTEPRAC